MSELLIIEKICMKLYYIETVAAPVEKTKSLFNILTIFFTIFVYTKDKMKNALNV